MTKQQALWAKQHDWYLGHGWKNQQQTYTVLVLDCGPHGDIEGPKEFADIKKLMEWAGY